MVSVLALKGTGEATRVLALQRAGGYLAGVWSYCGGHVEVGEAAWQAAGRELLEETGLVPAALHATSFCEQFYDSRNDVIEVVPAFVALVAESSEVVLNDEHSNYRWLTFKEAGDAYPFGSQRDLLLHVQREFVTRSPSKHTLIK